MNIIKYFKKLLLNWFVLFLLSLFLAGIANLLYYNFQIILPVFGNFFVQLIWFIIFISISMRQLLKSKLTKLKKFLLIFVALVAAFPIQFFNLVGAGWIAQASPFNISNCSDYKFYIRPPTGSFDTYGLFKSNFPLLYFQDVDINKDGNKISSDNGHTFIARRENFVSKSEFDKFVSCVNIKYDYTVVCENSHYYTTKSKPNEYDKDFNCK